MRLSHLALLAAAPMAALAAVAAPASAAPNPYSPNQVCGSGFGVVDHHQLRDRGKRLATVFLLYNAGSGRNCVVTLKRRQIGTPTSTTVSLTVRGAAGWQVDDGLYKYYAGPRYIPARHKCVRFGAAVSMPGGLQKTWISSWGHCG